MGQFDADLSILVVDDDAMVSRRNTPFMFVTSQRSMERMKITQAAQWSVDCYLVKPFRLDIFKQKIFEIMDWDEKVA
ncbi:MAG: hypothetical protein A2Z20_10520 [Bdellovibrionales bacterium RBG_16_40_8]|nr:MAG: hypothetical protein A2Z20_10520 [Bdellovibrionales bacterium RBG_16_40_8]